MHATIHSIDPILNIMKVKVNNKSAFLCPSFQFSLLSVLLNIYCQTSGVAAVQCVVMLSSCHGRDIFYSDTMTKLGHS